MRNIKHWTNSVENILKNINQIIGNINGIENKPTLDNNQLEKELITRIKQIQLANAAVYVLTEKINEKRTEENVNQLRDYLDLSYRHNIECIRNIKKYLENWGFEYSEGNLYLINKIKEFNELPIEITEYVLSVHEVYIMLISMSQYLHSIMLSVQYYEEKTYKK